MHYTNNLADYVAVANNLQLKWVIPLSYGSSLINLNSLDD